MALRRLSAEDTPQSSGAVPHLLSLSKNDAVDGNIAKTPKQRDSLTEGANMSTLHSSSDPVGLAIAREIQERVSPAEVVLIGSRAAGDHRPDSDVDLTAIAPDEAAAGRTRKILRELLEGKHDVPVVNVITITREEFRRAALLSQSFAGQATRHGVTPDGRSLDLPPGTGSHAGGDKGAHHLVAQDGGEPP